ncbi:MAG TPA: sialate O-acetylesterase, partial [Thermoguttaceae bacterium]|nr:sialate O-acetylesterase [Thermoguttaceae bacterium]
MARTWIAFVVAVLLSVCPTWAGDGDGKVKVFILAGQSNMEGLGHTRTLAHLGKDPQYGALLKKIRNDDGSWVVRDDVFISFRGGKTLGPLSVGFGANKEFVGPELMFGVVMGDAYKDPVLLVKTAWGGKGKCPHIVPPCGWCVKVFEEELVEEDGGQEGEEGMGLGTFVEDEVPG